MRIGEFAKICNTRISVLRHYDKHNLLKPVYIDQLTGYRHYSGEQISVFFRITALKQAGFSLREIRSLLKEISSDGDVLDIFEKKRAELKMLLHNLEDAERIMTGANHMNNLVFEERKEGIFTRYVKRGEIGFEMLCEEMEQELWKQDFQRISKITDDKTDIICQVVKLRKQAERLQENMQLSFEDDERVIGKWEAVGEYVTKEEFFEGKDCRPNWYYEYPRILYFLPEGERYWCFGWTKGKLLIETGDASFVNDYEVQMVGEENYMFVSYKSYDYCRGGVPKILVLRQVDNKRYYANELAKKDNIEMPFVEDDRILGKWKVFDFINSKEEFSPEGSGETPIFFKCVEFFPGGSCNSVYGEELITGDEKQVWTKGYLLRKWNSCACAYEIRTVDDREYLIMEWKSGDYRWGGFPTDYYVFVRE